MLKREIMRTETEIRARLEAMKANRKKSLEARTIWGDDDVRYKIKELVWVLGDDEK